MSDIVSVLRPRATEIVLGESPFSNSSTTPDNPRVFLKGHAGIADEDIKSRLDAQWVGSDYRTISPYVAADMMDAGDYDAYLCGKFS